MRVRGHVRACGLGLLLWACGGSGAALPGGEQYTLADPDFLFREEIIDSSARTVYDIVRTSRPQWLQTRGVTTIRQRTSDEGIRVYMDNAELGGVEALRTVGIGSVEYVQFFDAREATLRWGAGHLNGAILISTRPL